MYPLPVGLSSLPWPCPSRSSPSTKLGSLCYTAASHQLAVLHMVVYICQRYSICPTLSFPRRLQVHFLLLCLRIPPDSPFLALDWIIPTLEFSVIYTSAKPPLRHVSHNASFLQRLDYFSLENSNTECRRSVGKPVPISAALRLSLLFIKTASPSGIQRHHGYESQNKHDGCEFALCKSEGLMLISELSLLIDWIVVAFLTAFWPSEQWSYL